MPQTDDRLSSSLPQPKTLPFYKDENLDNPIKDTASSQSSDDIIHMSYPGKLSHCKEELVHGHIPSLLPQPRDELSSIPRPAARAQQSRLPAFNPHKVKSTRLKSYVANSHF